MSGRHAVHRRHLERRRRGRQPDAHRLPSGIRVRGRAAPGTARRPFASASLAAPPARGRRSARSAAGAVRRRRGAESQHGEPDDRARAADPGRGRPEPFVLIVVSVRPWTIRRCRRRTTSSSTTTCARRRRARARRRLSARARRAHARARPVRRARARPYGGLGLDVTTYARVIEELCRGWMSLAGVINSHTMAALIVLHHGTDAQRQRFLPRFARGEARGGLCPHRAARRHRRAGDPHGRAAPRRRLRRQRHEDVHHERARGQHASRCWPSPTRTRAAPPPRHVVLHRREGPSRLPRREVASPSSATRASTRPSWSSTSFVVPAANLVGGVEGRGFRHVMSGLEAGRINIAARAVGVAQAAFDDTLGHAPRSAARRPAGPRRHGHEAQGGAAPHLPGRPR